MNRACKSRGETMRDFRLPEPFDYRSDILTLKSELGSIPFLQFVDCQPGWLMTEEIRAD